MSKKSVLTSAVAHLRASGLKGKLRDDAAKHFLAGAAATDPDAYGELFLKANTYTDVLEALADAADVVEQAPPAEAED